MSSSPMRGTLQHRLQFEALVADLSARFVNLNMPSRSSYIRLRISPTLMVVVSHLDLPLSSPKHGFLWTNGLS